MKSRSMFLAAVLPFSFVGIARAQADLKTVILSPRVGVEIDARERDQFGLFPNVSGFVRATFVQALDSSFFAHIESHDRQGKTTTNILRYSRPVVFMMAERINHHEEIEQGTYQIGAQPLVLQIGDSLSSFMPAKTAPHVNPVTFTKLDTDLLHIERDDVAALVFPRLAVTYGLSSYSPDIRGIQAFFDAIEQKYRNEGYSIKRYSARPAPKNLSWYSIKVLLSDRSAIVAQAGSTGGENALNMKTFSLSFLYRISALQKNIFRPYVMGGIERVKLNVNQSYKYQDRVSPVDTSGGYTVLSSVTVSGAQSTTGFSVGAGFELVSPGPGSSIAFNGYIRKSFLPSIEIPLTGATSVPVKTQSLMFGFDFQYYF